MTAAIRLASLSIFVLVIAAALMPISARAADVAPVEQPSFALRQTAQPIDQHDDSRVGVQLVVAGIAAGLVVGVGSAAFLVRRRLGLTAYDPAKAAGNGHH